MNDLCSESCAEELIPDESCKRVRKFFNATIACIGNPLFGAPLESAGFKQTCLAGDLDCVVFTAQPSDLLIDLTVCALLNISFLPDSNHCSGLLQICTSSNITVALSADLTTVILTLAVSTAPYVIKICNIKCFQLTQVTAPTVPQVTITVCSPFIPTSNTVTVALSALITASVVFTNSCSGLNFDTKIVTDLISKIDKFLRPCMSKDKKQLKNLADEIAANKFRRGLKMCNDKCPESESSSCSEDQDCHGYKDEPHAYEEEKMFLRKRTKERVFVEVIDEFEAKRKFCDECEFYEEDSCSDTGKNRKKKCRKRSFVEPCDDCVGEFCQDQFCPWNFVPRCIKRKRDERRHRRKHGKGRRHSKDSDDYSCDNYGGQGSYGYGKGSGDDYDTNKYGVGYNSGPGYESVQHAKGNTETLSRRKFFNTCLGDILKTALAVVQGKGELQRNAGKYTPQLDKAIAACKVLRDANFLKFLVGCLFSKKVDKKQPMYNLYKSTDVSPRNDYLYDLGKLKAYEKKSDEYKRLLRDLNLTTDDLKRDLYKDNSELSTLLLDVFTEDSQNSPNEYSSFEEFETEDLTEDTETDTDASSSVAKKKPSKKDAWSTGTKVLVGVSAFSVVAVVVGAVWYFLV